MSCYQDINIFTWLPLGHTDYGQNKEKCTAAFRDNQVHNH